MDLYTCIDRRRQQEGLLAVSAGVTLLDTLIQAVGTATAYNKQDQAAPVAVLWPDQERQWKPLLKALGD